MPAYTAANQRPTIREALQSRTFDVIVIGGGITGAGIALDAASRGLSVALLEKNDFASGTSSKSTKLIHGGLRYLKQLEFGLVREVGQERAIVHRLAPHLVLGEKMLIPVVKGGSLGPLSTSLGLWVYDLLAGVKGDDRRVMLNPKRTLEKEPMLSSTDLLGSGYYAEYRTDDSRLTIELIKTAMQHGAVVLNYTAVEGLIYNEQKQVKGVVCQDEMGPDRWTVQGKIVVNAAGPWVDEIRKQDRSLQGKKLFLSKGVHIVVPQAKLPIQQAAYFDVGDGRMVFAIPRQDITYIGTTDTAYHGDPNRIPIEKEDVAYLLAATNRFFPKAQLAIEDVESGWAGVRPLIYEEGKSASEMSRRDEIFTAPSGLISIAGGKLTGYRKMAQRVVNRVAKTLGNKTACQTAKISLAGGPFLNAADVNLYIQQIMHKLQELNQSATEAPYLVHNYGRQADVILQDLRQGEDFPLLQAEVRFTIAHELATHPLDFLNRRSGRLYFRLPATRPAIPLALDIFQEAFSWSPEQRQRFAHEVSEAIDLITTFPSSTPLPAAR